MSFPFPLPLILRGATGTNLIAAGMPSGVCVEQWIFEHPEKLLALQRAFLEAGSNAVMAPVSYTHLDVYKRQVVLCALIKFFCERHNVDAVLT